MLAAAQTNQGMCKGEIFGLRVIGANVTFLKMITTEQLESISQAEMPTKEIMIISHHFHWRFKRTDK